MECLGFSLAQSSLRNTGLERKLHYYREITLGRQTVPVTTFQSDCAFGPGWSFDVLTHWASCRWSMWEFSIMHISGTCTCYCNPHPWGCFHTPSSSGCCFFTGSMWLGLSHSAPHPAWHKVGLLPLGVLLLLILHFNFSVSSKRVQKLFSLLFPSFCICAWP